MAHELKRVDRGDGHHEVTVALGAVDSAIIVVPNEHLDGPGFKAMLDLMLQRHVGLVRMREGLPR